MVLDVGLFHLINGLAGRMGPIDAAMRLFVNEYFVPTTMSLLLLVLWFSGDDALARLRCRIIPFGRASASDDALACFKCKDSTSRRASASEASVERERNQRAVLQAVITLGLANAVVKLCNLIYFRPRPFAAHEVNLLFYRPTDSSMPSNPAAIGFSFATAVWLRNRRVGGIMYILATLFAFARVYCGVHYPSDIVVGALIAIISAYIVVRKAGFLEPLVAFAIKVGKRICLA